MGASAVLVHVLLRDGTTRLSVRESGSLRRDVKLVAVR